MDCNDAHKSLVEQLHALKRIVQDLDGIRVFKEGMACLVFDGNELKQYVTVVLNGIFQGKILIAGTLLC